MKKILIAEDEKLIRMGIEVMIKNSGIDYTDVISFKNGKQTWDYLVNEDNVDLVITDVRMPVSDGIELVKKISNLQKPPYVLVISGYSDFEYVVQMLRNGAVDYLLKPLNRNEFVKRLYEIDGMIERKYDYSIKLQKILEEELNQFFSQNQYELDFLHSFLNSVTNFDDDVRYQIHCDNKFIREPDSIYIGNVDGNHFSAIFQNFNYENTIHQGKEFINEAIIEAYITRLNHFYGSTTLDFSSYKLVDEATVLSWIQDLFMNKNKRVSKELLKKINAIQQAELHPQVLSQTNNIIFESIQKYYGFINAALTVAMYPKETYYYDNVDTYIRALREWENLIIEKIDVNEIEDKKLINDALEYINNNFHKDINMVIVSNYVNMNYSVFSQLFKEHLGINFVDYIKNRRIDEAKKLLLEGELLVREVSESVGYFDYKYFARLFKQEVGMSPSEYRRIVGDR